MCQPSGGDQAAHVESLTCLRVRLPAMPALLATLVPPARCQALPWPGGGSPTLLGVAVSSTVTH